MIPLDCILNIDLYELLEKYFFHKEKFAKDVNIPFMGKKIMSNNFMFGLTNLIIKEMQIETQIRYLLFLVCDVGKIINDYSHCC